MDFNEMLNGLFNITFITEEEKELLYKAGELYARGKAIEFAKKISGAGYQQYDEPDRWIAPHDSLKVYTTVQLFELFNKKVIA